MSSSQPIITKLTEWECTCMIAYTGYLSTIFGKEATLLDCFRCIFCTQIPASKPGLLADFPFTNFHPLAQFIGKHIPNTVRLRATFLREQFHGECQSDSVWRFGNLYFQKFCDILKGPLSECHKRFAYVQKFVLTTFVPCNTHVTLSVNRNKFVWSTYL